MGDKTGGETSATNTAPLCVRNHQGKTRKKWKYHRNDGSYQWENTRTGHTYRSHPPERWNHPTGPTRPPSIPTPTAIPSVSL
ncbi:MAG: hypothetical protein JWM76_1749, partial [Pseudonocardiales bacterium]|nr:hypothetical protein [Pseudonocardiales bacterium]